MKKLLKRPQIYEAQIRSRWAGFSQPWHLVSLLVVSLFSFLFSTSGDAYAFCERAVGDRVGSTCHAEMVEKSLDFLRPEFKEAMESYIIAPDHDTIRPSDDHFDDCNFDGATEQINNRYGLALNYLLPKTTWTNVPYPHEVSSPSSPFNALAKWAYALHAAQDFYSHTNWVFLHDPTLPRPLADTGIELWTEHTADWSPMPGFPRIISAQDDMPSGWFFFIFENGGFSNLVSDGQNNVYSVLISGETGKANSCPDPFHPHHDDVHMDNIDRPLHLEAADTAKAQTRHEWCRLLHLAYENGGAGLASIPLGLMVEPGRSPHPVGTPCEEASPGVIEVTVAITKIKVLDDKDPGSTDPGELNYAFTLYTDNFKRSVHSQTPVVSVETGNEVPATSLPEPLTMCISWNDRLIATVQGWEDDGNNGVLALGETMLVGASHVVGQGSQLAPGTSGLGSFTVISDYSNVINDLEVTFEVTNLHSDADGDGISRCNELNVGLDPNNPDTDGDGLPDNEAQFYGTDPLKADSDGDGLLDGSDVDFVHVTLNAQPQEAFASPADYQNLHDLLDVIEATLLGGDLETAVNQVLEMRQKVNGCGIEPDGDDVIIYCEPQREIRSLLDLLMRNLGLDLDFDWLPDYFEMVIGSDYMYPDTDGDGLLDGLDIEFVRYIFDAQPMQVYMSQGDYEDIQDRLILIEESLYLEQAEVALTQLQSLLERMNGCGDTPDADDAFADCTAQMEVRNYIEMLMSNLQKQSDSTNISKKSVGPF